MSKIKTLLTRCYTWFYKKGMTPNANFRSVSNIAGVMTLVMLVATVRYTRKISYNSLARLSEPLSMSNSTHLSPLAHCPWLLNMTRQSRTYVSMPVDPPWTHKLANYRSTVAFGENLYLWPCNPQRNRRFGNQLFNFAAVFGVAWRNKRIALWPSHNTHVSAFQHRLILDKTFLRKVRIAATVM